jgi:uncharacterized repeat protein (TIGR02059 family)
MADLVPSLKLSPTLMRIRAQRQAELDAATPAKPPPKVELEPPAADAAPAGMAADTPAVTAGEPAVTASAGSSWLSPDSPLLKPLPSSVPAELQSFFGGIPMGALGTGALLLAGAAGLASSGGKGGGAPAAAADTAAPALLGAKLNDSGTQLILNYSETVSSALPDKASFVVNANGVANAVTAVARGSDASTVVLTLGSKITSAQTVRVSLADGAVVRDAAGNVAATFRDQAVVVTDKTAPDRLSASVLTGSNGSVIVLRYSEELLASAKPELSSFAVTVNGSVASLSAVDVSGDAVRLTLATPLANPNSATVRLSFTQPSSASSALQDAAGNQTASITDTGGLLIPSSQDLSAPTPDSALNSAALVGLPSRLVRLKFTELLDASALPDAASLLVQLNSGGSSRNVAVSALKVVGDVLELTLADTVSDPLAGLRVSYTPPTSGAALQDWAGNDVAAFSRSLNLGDLIPPGLVSSRFTSATELELTFTEDLASLGADKGSYSLTANGGATLKPTSVNATGKLLKLNFDTAVLSGQAASLSYTAPASDASLLNQALQDSAGNDALGFTQVLDTTAPTLLSAITSNDGLRIGLSYSEALLSANPSGTPVVPAVAATAFKVFRGQGNEVTVSSVTLNGGLVTLNLASALSASDTVTVFYVPPSANIGVANAALQDASGNDAAALGSGVTGQVVTNDVRDAVAPTITSFRASSNAVSTSVVLTANEALLASATAPGSAFTVLNESDGSTLTVSQVEVIGREVYLRLASRLSSSSGLKISYTAPANSADTANAALQDLVGNDAAGFADRSTSLTVDSTTPTVLSATTSADGNQVLLTFSEELDPATAPDLSRLALTAAGAAVTINALSISGATLTLNLGQRLHTLSTFELGYTDATSGDDRLALQDAAGNDVASFTGQAVVDAVDRSAPQYVATSLKSSTVLQLRFGEALGGVLPTASAFSVNSGSSVLAISSLQLVGGFLELSLAAPLSSASGVTVSYTAPTANIANSNAALQDALGNDVASFTTGALDGSAPTLVSAVTNAAGTQVLLTYSEALATTTASPNAFRVADANTTYSVNSVSVNGSVLTLNLGGTLPNSGAIFVSYTAPVKNDTLGNAALQDSTGNDAEAITIASQRQVSNKVAPTLSQVTLDSQALALDTVVLTLSETMVGTAPDKSAFSVSLGAAVQSIDSLSVSGSEVKLKLTNGLASDGTLRVSYTPPASNPLQDSDNNPVAAQTEFAFGQVKTGTGGTDNLVGSSGLNDYFLGSAGNDSLSGLGGADGFTWPDFGTNGPGGWAQTIKDFGFKKGSGTLQGSAEADLLDLSQLLDGYTSSSTPADFLRFGKNADNKLLLNIDHNGGTSFESTASVLFDNVTIDATNQVLAGGQLVSHNAGNLTLADVLTHLMTEKQLSVL